PFAVIAIFDLWQVKNIREKKLKNIIVTLFTDFLLLTFGSGYYHWQPNNETLVYDQIPITIVLMSFLPL
ncbi:MAG: hypothetical protein WKF91_22430, partial [Segetibacter sp.]